MRYESTNHIIVLQGGRISSAKILNEIGEIEPAEVIFNRIKLIEYTKTESIRHKLFHLHRLIMLERTNWAKLRKHCL